MKLSGRQITVLAALGGLTLVLVAVGVYGLISGPKQPSNPLHTAEPSSRPTAAPPNPTDPLHPIAVTGDAERFAESVAHAIFDWDTAENVDPTAILDHLLEAADPTGFETPGLYQDLGGYLPTTTQWQQLRRYDTTQQLTIDTIGIPASWAGIAADPANAITPGTIAVTVEGTRTRSGGWHGEETTKSYPVEFTMFLVCPEDGSCSLLRLSRLGAALR